MNLSLLLAFAAPYRRGLACAGAFMLLDTVATLALPWFAGRLAQEAIGGQDAVPALMLWALTLLGVQACLRYGSNLLMGRAAANILADLRTRIYDHLQSLPLTFFQQRRQGEILALLTHEVTQLAGFISGTLLAIAPSLITVAGAMVLMARIDLALAAMVGLLVPAFYLGLKMTGRRLRVLGRQMQEAEAAAVAIADENLNMLPAIKTFTREAEESVRFALTVEAIRSLSEQQMKAYAAFEPIVQFVAMAAAVMLLWLASDRIGAASMTPAELVSFMLYALLLTRPVARLAGSYGQALMSVGTLQRLHTVLKERPETESDVLQVMPAVKGAIEFRHVSFTYPDRAPTLRNVSLHIHAGETVAITGQTERARARWPTC